MSDEAFRAFFRNSPDAIVILDASSGRILGVNPATHRVLGHDNGALVGQRFSVLFLSDFSLSPQEFLGKITFPCAPFKPAELCRADGSVCHMQLSATAIPWGDDEAVLVTLRDTPANAAAATGSGPAALDPGVQRGRSLGLLNRVIKLATSTLDANHVLHVACEELGSALDLPRVLVALFNADGSEATIVAAYAVPGHLRCLRRAVRIADFPALMHVLDCRAPLVLSELSADERLAPLELFVSQCGAVSPLIVPVTAARGRSVGAFVLDPQRRREFSQEEMLLAQSVAAVAGQALEMARLYEAMRRQAERLQETVAERTVELQQALERARDADRVKSEFVSNVSHELRSPLTNLKLYLSLIGRSQPERHQDYLDTLHREADRLHSVIEGLLDLSRLELHKTQANLEPADLNELVSNLAADRYALVADRGLKLILEQSDDLPLAWADSRLIQQVVTNLLANAINYTPEGGTLTLRTGTAKTHEGQWVTISVADTGPGMSEEEQERLFERFYRGEAGRRSRAPGVGLGLAISKEITDRHHGRITLDSKPGRGSTFTVWLMAAA